MNILFCGDCGVADGVVICTLSLMAHVREALHIYLLTADISHPEKCCTALSPRFAGDLDALVRGHGSDSYVKRYDMTHAVAEMTPTANMSTRFTPCCMLRLYADMIDELPDRILYLDSDVICRGDPGEFYNQRFSGASLAGVLDNYGSWFFRRNPFRRDYLNSGVLLLNMEQIRGDGLFERCRRRCAEKKMFMPDQSAINKLCRRKLICPRRFNEQRHLHDDTVFHHFTTFFRFFPWFRAVTVKPWDIEAMHDVLHLSEYDALLSQYQKYKEKHPW